MGERLYYLIEFIVFIGIGVYSLFKPEYLKKLISNKLVVRILAVVCLAYGCVNLYNFLNY